jgi:hypothetical protein
MNHIRKIEEFFTQYLIQIFTHMNLGFQSPPFDISKWDITTTMMTCMQDTPAMLPLLSSIAYLHTLLHVPSLIRLWYNASQNRQLLLSVSTFTQQHYSPYLIDLEFSNISPIEGIIVTTTRGSVNEVHLKYCVEECTLSMYIKVPQTYPLRQVEIHGIFCLFENNIYYRWATFRHSGKELEGIYAHINIPPFTKRNAL